MSEKLNLQVEIRGPYPSALNPLQSLSIYNRDNLAATEILLSDPNSHVFSVQCRFFLKIITMISRTLQALKTWMGSVPFILARNQFLLFSQVLNMFEIGCCQSLQSLPNQQIQWLHFRSHPPTPLESLPHFHTQRPPPFPRSRTKPVHYLCIHQASDHHQGFPLTGYLALPTVRSVAAQAHTQPAQMLLQLSPHCPSGRSSTGLLNGSKPQQQTSSLRN